jgi:predicted DNA-binding transcriptional regulator YafY
MRRIERLINLIAALLEARRPMTAEEIRSRIAGYAQDSHEAFRRAFERDKEALRAMGIPLELRALDSLTDHEQGYTISKESYYLPDLDLEPDELAALAIATETLAERRGHPATSGLLKLSVAHDAATTSAPRLVAGADLAVGDPRLGAIYSAVLDRRPIGFPYEDARGRRSQRRVEPWALVHRAGHWYLSGRDMAVDERRTFKVARIAGEIQQLEGSQGGSYEPPRRDEATASIGAEAWEFGGDEVADVRVYFEPEARWWAEQNLAHLTSREAPEGRLEVEMPTANVEALLSWVIGWDGTVAVVSPPEVRKRLRDHLSPWLGQRGAGSAGPQGGCGAGSAGPQDKGKGRS